MRFAKHVGGLFKELGHFAWANKAWWIIPVVLALFVVAAVLYSAGTASPFIYTLF
jgi:hypothetical protein